MTFENVDVEVQGDTLFISGTFSGLLTYAEGAEAILDPDRKRSVAGSFVARLPKQ